VVKPESKPVANAAYLYGRFRLVHDSQGLGRLRMGLIVEGESNAQNYTIEFIPDGTPSMIAVKPGTYRMKKVLFAYWDYARHGEKQIPEDKLTKAFKAEPGKAYYLGDFTGKTVTRVGYSTVTNAWALKEIDDKFKQTTADTRKKYPGLNQLEYLRAVTF
jgi:hypothetical protein